MAPHSSWPAASRICRLTALPEPSSNGGSASGWTTECLGRWWFGWENVRENHGKKHGKTIGNHGKPMGKPKENIGKNHGSKISKDFILGIMDHH